MQDTLCHAHFKRSRNDVAFASDMGFSHCALHPACDVQDRRAGAQGAPFRPVLFRLSRVSTTIGTPPWLCIIPRPSSTSENGVATLISLRWRWGHSVLLQAKAATDILHATNACSLKIRSVEAVVRWRRMLNVL
jgi:hypothetical protein